MARELFILNCSEQLKCFKWRLHIFISHKIPFYKLCTKELREEEPSCYFLLSAYLTGIFVMQPNPV